MVSLALFACGPQRAEFKGTDVTGVDWGKDFRLTDHTGKPRTLADFHGKVVAIFFGYTHCPDVCPTTLAEMAAVMKRLGKEAERVQVLFVTLDPARDTPDLLAQYVPSFNPTFLGLYGDEATTRETAQQFKVFFQKRETGSKVGYTLDHAANTFLYDPAGRLRVVLGFGSGVDNITHDIKELLAGH
jgi:protein SCO1/2